MSSETTNQSQDKCLLLLHYLKTKHKMQDKMNNATVEQFPEPYNTWKNELKKAVANIEILQDSISTN